MRCALVFYFVATIFLVVYSEPELCLIEDGHKGKTAYCGNHSVNYTFDFIPPVYQNIFSINLWGQPLKRLPYNAFRNLSSQSSISGIWLEHCQISHVDAGALLNLYNLTEIDLSNNNITHIDSKLFSHTKQIKFIHMKYNKIEVLPSGLFQNLTLLEAVYLGNNRIRQVERYSFKNTPSLLEIDLRTNQIEFMNILFKDQFDGLIFIYLNDNPWKCDCELVPLYELVIKIIRPMHYGFVCDKPPTLHGREWSSISRDEFVCPSEDASTQVSVITTTSTEPMTTTEQDDNIPVTVYNGTSYQPVDTGIPQPPSNQNWILYTILVLVLMCLAVLIIGVVFVVRYTLVTSNKSRHVPLPTIVKRRTLWGTNARQMDTGIPMCVIQSSAVSKYSDSASNTDDMDEEQTSVHQYAIREATTN